MQVETTEQNEITALVREGKQLPEGRIEVTFTQEDIDKAKGYFNNTDCFLCTALKRMGYKHTLAYGLCIEADGTVYHFASASNDPASPQNQNAGRSIVGKTLVLQR